MLAIQQNIYSNVYNACLITLKSLMRSDDRLLIMDKISNIQLVPETAVSRWVID